MEKVIEQLRGLYGYTEAEAEEAFNFVVELLQEKLDYVDKTAPYAVKTMEHIDTAIDTVQLLQLDM
jgi:hypothetical protein